VFDYILLIFYNCVQHDGDVSPESPFTGLFDHNQTRHIRHDSSGRVISPTQRPLPDNTQYSKETHSHAPEKRSQTYLLNRMASENNHTTTYTT